MRFSFLLLFAAPLFAVDCRHTDGPGDSAVCAKPELRALDQRIEEKSAALEAKLPADGIQILKDTRVTFARDRNSCPDLPSCIEKLMIAREATLDRAAADPAAIRDLIGQAHSIDIGFLWKYWKDLVGHKVTVYGCYSPPETGPKTKAELETENQKSVPLVFSSMPEDTFAVLDDQKPCSNWVVTVRRQGTTFELFADEILDQQLP